MVLAMHLVDLIKDFKATLFFKVPVPAPGKKLTLWYENMSVSNFVIEETV